MPTSRASGPSPTTDWPAILMSPASGATMPAISRSSTVLPAPDGPKIAIVSPRSTDNAASRSTSSLPKRRLTPSITRKLIVTP